MRSRFFSSFASSPSSAGTKDDARLSLSHRRRASKRVTLRRLQRFPSCSGRENTFGEFAGQKSEQQSTTREANNGKDSEKRRRQQRPPAAFAQALARFGAFTHSFHPRRPPLKRPQKLTTNLLIGDDLDAVVLPDTDAPRVGSFDGGKEQREVSRDQSFQSFPCASNRPPRQAAAMKFF